MLIRSMSGKEPTFKRLIDYVSREVSDPDYALYHNILARKPGDLVDEFNENAKLLRKYKNGNVMYHEIVSIQRPEALASGDAKSALQDITSRYVQERAPHNLVYGGLHDDHDGHIHYHLVISANPVGLSKRHWLTKTQFRQIAIDLEHRVLAHYPELEQSVSIDKEAGLKLSAKERSIKARTGKRSKKEVLRDALKVTFQSAASPDGLEQQLTELGVSLYRRGKSVGVVDNKTGRRYRLKTLGIMTEFEAASARFTQTRTPGKLNQDLPKAPEQISTATKIPEETETMDPSTFLNLGTGLLDALTLTNQASEGGEKVHEKAKDDSAEQAASKEDDLKIIAEARREEMKKLRRDRQRSKENKSSNAERLKR